MSKAAGRNKHEMVRGKGGAMALGKGHLFVWTRPPASHLEAIQKLLKLKLSWTSQCQRGASHPFMPVCQH